MANGLFGGGDGSEENPYLVEDMQDLEAIHQKLFQNPRYYYKQTSDIDLGSIINWKPIGNPHVGPPFLGYYDGDNYSINNLKINYIDTTNLPYLGLFASCSGGQIKNVKMENAIINSVGSKSGTQSIGILCGQATQSANLNNCSVSGIIDAPKGGNSTVGGLIGWIEEVNLYNCAAKNVVLKGYNVGGLVGRFINSFIDNCYSEGELYGNIGAVDNGVNSIGGLVASINTTNEFGSISNSYAVVDIFDYEPNSYLHPFINLGNIIDLDIISSYYKKIDYIVYQEQDYGKTENDMMQKSTYVDWDFDNIWKIADGKSYPVLFFESDPEPVLPYVTIEEFIKLNGVWLPVKQ